MQYNTNINQKQLHVICIMLFRLDERECFLKPAWQRTIASIDDVMFRRGLRRRYNFRPQYNFGVTAPSMHFHTTLPPIRRIQGVPYPEPHTLNYQRS